MTTDKALNTDKLEAINAVSVGDEVLHRNPNRAMQEMMDIITDLRHVYTEENDALLNADVSRFLSLQEEKIRTARRYQFGAKQLLERKDEFKKADPDLRKKLLDMHEDFSGLTATNLTALERMRKGTQRLGDRIMSAAREAARKDTPNYSRTGSLNKNERALSITINESA